MELFTKAVPKMELGTSEKDPTTYERGASRRTCTSPVDVTPPMKIQGGWRV
jgi:hypothetical protein